MTVVIVVIGKLPSCNQLVFPTCDDSNNGLNYPKLFRTHISCFTRLVGVRSPPASCSSGCLLSGAGDLSFDLNGYLWAITSCVLQSAYLILVERTGTEKGERCLLLELPSQRGKGT